MQKPFNVEVQNMNSTTDQRAFMCRRKQISDAQASDCIKHKHECMNYKVDWYYDITNGIELRNKGGLKNTLVK